MTAMVFIDEKPAYLGDSPCAGIPVTVLRFVSPCPLCYTLPQQVTLMIKAKPRMV